MTRPKIAMITMFKNESKVIRRMLESCAPHIDFWVIQNNGSTDGTDEIIREFFKEHPIPGVLYDVEEGWVGFGWNRDHLIRTCQSIDHGCDWILKMDCDETLQIDDNFDWQILADKTIQAWHVVAECPPHLYHRAWLYNADLPWGFDHDPCHETVYCQLEHIGHNFYAQELPYAFRQIGYREGQSWGNPTKFISDSLILEEKLISEGKLLENMYHFFYIGKSYFDCYQTDSFPLKQSQQREYARRAIYYLKAYVNFKHGIFDGKSPKNPLDEMSYISLTYAGECYLFIDDYENAEKHLQLAEQFAPERNDHLIILNNLYEKTKQYTKLLATTSRLIDPTRTNPFPKYNVFINMNHYANTGSYVFELHEKALALNRNLDKSEALPFYINKLPRKKLFVVDNFYSNPDQIREYALKLEYKNDLRFYKGLRTTATYRPKGMKEAFQHIIGEEISGWDYYEHNGVFQITTADDPQVYHHDLQKWAGMIYMTPHAPYESGTRLHISKINGASMLEQGPEALDQAYQHGFYDSTKFHIVDVAGNVYNRLVIMDARNMHSAGSYFGKTTETGRLIHLFFFD